MKVASARNAVKDLRPLRGALRASLTASSLRPNHAYWGSRCCPTLMNSCSHPCPGTCVTHVPEPCKSRRGVRHIKQFPGFSKVRGFGQIRLFRQLVVLGIGIPILFDFL